MDHQLKAIDQAKENAAKVHAERSQEFRRILARLLMAFRTSFTGFAFDKRQDQNGFKETISFAGHTLLSIEGTQLEEKFSLASINNRLEEPALKLQELLLHDDAFEPLSGVIDLTPEQRQHHEAVNAATLVVFGIVKELIDGYKTRGGLDDDGLLFDEIFVGGELIYSLRGKYQTEGNLGALLAPYWEPVTALYAHMMGEKLVPKLVKDEAPTAEAAAA